MNKQEDPIEAQTQILAQQPMRKMITLQCDDCAREWVAPAIGACPSCHRSNVLVLESRVSQLKTI